ncbi:MAG: ATP-grasp domain-containing protein [Myxococcota bacterium]
MTVHVLFENPDWMPPVRRAFGDRGIPLVEHFVEGGAFDVQAPPPEGIWLNRMSPSAHTRGHADGVAYVREWLSVLEAAGRRVINGSAAFALEVSKVRQHAALEAMGIRTPRTIAVVGRAGLRDAARRMELPFITKHNQGGKGLGVQLFRDLDAFDAYVESERFEPATDGVTLLQQYVQPRDGAITRVEIVDGRFLYAIRAATDAGFQLCPADACEADSAFCPVGGTGRFSRRELSPDDPLVRAYVAFCERHAIDVAGIEYVEDEAGERWTYDVNMNTNYNGEVEAAHGLDGMAAIAALCERLLGRAAA